MRTLRFYVSEGILPAPRRQGKTPVYAREWILNALLAVHLMKTRLGASLSDVGQVIQHLNEDPEILADQVERVAKEHGVTYFFIVDSVFNISAANEIAFADALRRRSLDVSWGAFFSPGRLTRGYLQALKSSGLTHIEFGTDSLSDVMLDSYRKGFSVAEAMHAATLAEHRRLLRDWERRLTPAPQVPSPNTWRQA